MFIAPDTRPPWQQEIDVRRKRNLLLFTVVATIVGTVVFVMLLYS